MVDEAPQEGMGSDASPPGAARAERIKLTAAYLNALAGGLSTAGVFAPLAAAVFGITGPSGGLPALTLIVGVTIFLIASIALHVAARIALKGLDQ